MRNWKSLGRVVLVITAGGLASGAALAGTTLECTDDTRALHEFVADQATAPPGETSGAPIEAVAGIRAGAGEEEPGTLAKPAPRVPRSQVNSSSKMGI